MHADIGGHTTALIDVAFPRGIIPIAARSDIGQVDVVDMVFRPFVDLFLQLLDLVVQAQLKDIVSLVTLSLFHFFEGIDVPRIEHEWLFADDITT